ncbi:hypothetical protein Sste5346_003932 [Sporothrix stenoceras]|uniref:Uncharacterized protein n=1 Tax=Sporothrix stenoceras TaxID=5173 RepID=A0ABR3ZC48_9PEZI
MRLSSIINLLAASVVEASLCRPSKPAASVSSSSSSPSFSPSPSTIPCNTNRLIDQSRGVSPPTAWQYAPLSGVTVSYPATCNNNAYNQAPDGSCVNFLLREAPPSAVTAVTISRALDTVVGTTYSFGFSFRIGSDEPDANAGDVNKIVCSADNTAQSNGWAPFFLGYPEDTLNDFGISFTASAATTTVTCVLTVDTAIDFTVSNYYLSALCS